MPWYSSGSVAVSANSATVTGTGTAFSANARVGDAFIGPDGALYEVTNIASANVLSISPDYEGETASGQPYKLAPMQGYVKESADRLRKVTDEFGAILADIGENGATIKIDAEGLLADRAVYNTEAAGFTYFATDTELLYIKTGVAADAWSNGAPVARGPAGATGDITPELEQLRLDAQDAASAAQDAASAVAVIGAGWTPVIATVADGERRVQLVIDWTGGESNKPATGKYVGATGFVSDIAQATDVRGAAGSGSVESVSGVLPDGNGNVELNAGDVGALAVDATATNSERYAGMLPPPSDGKSYAVKDGTWVEVSGGSGSPLLSIEWFAGLRSALATERPGCVPVDGQILDRAVWPEAWAKIDGGTRWPLVTDAVHQAGFANKRCFSSGNGTTTFRNMDLNGVTTGKAYFLRGSPSDSFSLKEDILQNITAGMGGVVPASGTVSGAVNTFAADIVVLGGGAAAGVRAATFDASRVARTGTETAPAHASGVWIIRLADAGSASNPGTVDVTALASQVSAVNQAVQPVMISGSIGTFLTGTSIAGPGYIGFNEIWVNEGGIVNDNSTTFRHFKVPVAGKYRVTGIFVSGGNTNSNRILLGINSSSAVPPSQGTGGNKGQTYAGAFSTLMPMNSLISLNSGDTISFYLAAGSIQNTAIDPWGQFSIEKVG